MTTDGSEEFMKFSAELASASVMVGVRAGDAMSKALRDIEAGAKNRVAVDTGATKNSISHNYSRKGSTLRGEVGPTTKYAGFLERGDGKGHQPQPFLRPATDAVVPGYEAALGQLGAELLEGD